MTSFGRLQAWFVGQCDGDWEHGGGITISSLDNPGWQVDIALVDTYLEGREFHKVHRNLSDSDWLHVSRTPTEFKIRCSPNNLDEGLGIFCDWADSKPIEGE
ncbi:MAG: immunity 53 family protein [Terracidiphilus sp.]|jgi:hypothetical protein